MVDGDGGGADQATGRILRPTSRLIVVDDEREEKASDGRALLNLGHTFAHALEAEMGFDGRLLHGEAVGIGLALSFRLSARLGHCSVEDAARVEAHLAAMGMKHRIADCGQAFDPETLVAHMRRDKKMRDGRLAFVLAHGIGHAFTSIDVEHAEVLAVLGEAMQLRPSGASDGRATQVCDAPATSA